MTVFRLDHTSNPLFNIYLLLLLLFHNLDWNWPYNWQLQGNMFSFQKEQTGNSEHLWGIWNWIMLSYFLHNRLLKKVVFSALPSVCLQSKVSSLFFNSLSTYSWQASSVPSSYLLTNWMYLDVYDILEMFEVKKYTL